MTTPMTADEHYRTAVDLLNQAHMLTPSRPDAAAGGFRTATVERGGWYGLNAPANADRLIAAAHVHALLAGVRS
ncbi:hypothetical protein O7623_00900 [Solwaraspora sp. WMMD791]|uniref:hypothetical protein n=1 Tax=Solwaraspora sp. WMMD791 TaxID=3016086 RepID=UPI00249B5FEB|nr:hypothetical protein [Solwaraspora sp. WMMD791]WFE27804.1 hypothetical protein O7623_00900 [Solwaraspora sp. WMMD791]